MQRRGFLKQMAAVLAAPTALAMCPPQQHEGNTFEVIGHSDCAAMFMPGDIITISSDIDRHYVITAPRGRMRLRR